MGNKEIEEYNIKDQTYKFIGVTFILIGLIIAIILFSDFIHRKDQNLNWLFTSDSTIQDFGTALVGTTGVLWTLAGTILFYYSLIQTKLEISLQIKEMKQTNTSLISQRYETTFFNLLDNQKSILNNVVYKEHLKGKNLVGSAALGYIVNKINKYLSVYNKSLANKYFNSVDETKFNQTCLYEKFEVLSSISDSVIHIIDYIIDKLENSEFHHKTLYFNLTNDEKFIIGLVLYNKIKVIPKLEYNYSQYYLENSNFSLLGYDIPVCNITDLPNQKIRKIEFTEFGDFEKKIRNVSKFTFIPNNYIEPIMITSIVNIEAVTQSDFNFITSIITNSINHHKIDTIDFDLYHIFQDYLLNSIKNYKDAKSYFISISKLGFVFSYNNTTYEVLLGSINIILDMVNNELELKLSESEYNDEEDQNIFTLAV